MCVCVRVCVKTKNSHPPESVVLVPQRVLSRVHWSMHWSRRMGHHVVLLAVVLGGGRREGGRGMEVCLEQGFIQDF